MNLSQLEAFLLLADGLSVTETSERLHCTQPSISIKIKKLEEQLKTVLFERINNRLHLTPQGKLYQQYASQIMNMIDTSSRHMRQFDDPNKGEIKLGASHFVGVYYLPQVIAKFKKQYPLVRFSMDISKSHQLLRKLNQQELDFLVMADNVAFDENEYKLESFLSDPFVLICAPGHQLAKKQSCHFSEVLTQTFIIKSKKSTTTSFLLAKSQSISSYDGITNSIEIDSIEGIKQAVIHGLGVSIVSRLSVEQEINAGLLHALTIDDINFTRGVRYIHHKNKYLSPATQNFLSMLKGVVD
ncbi:LysR family transcriptional regulator [Vibrio sp. V19_P1S1T109]|uniref:LysR family transcriptional regulator n=1 Tax=Vibrio sp. V19_P1S1T109 TaxID=1938672 RepID=UPI000B8EACC3|nr:LysR family transcriptional regulator [Vibrio sp. V19_P1S1T109]OXX69248.1 LysR family transcriptional regulator [Vibrio sp. V19_P1S1T109]